MILGGWEVERDWEREGEANGCEIVCMCVWVGVRVGMQRVGGGAETVRNVMHH